MSSKLRLATIKVFMTQSQTPPKTDRVFSFLVPAINLSSISHPAMRKRRRKETRSLKDTLCNADFVSFSRLQQNEEDKGKVGKNGAKSKNVFFESVVPPCSFFPGKVGGGFV